MQTANKTKVLGIDLGGTHIRAGLVAGDQLSEIVSQKIPSHGTAEELLHAVFAIIDPLIDNTVTAIGIGVPGLADTVSGTVFDAVNIPAWKEIPLQQWMVERYGLPVAIQNDANCFALGELWFGKGKGYHSFVGLTIGTGLGAGIIIDKKLYAGRFGGAGEFGMIPYRDQYYEYYASGRFFQHVYGMDGETVFQQANNGDAAALAMYTQLGTHLGQAIQTILYALDMGLIILGGSLRHAYPYFSAALWQQLGSFAYKRTIHDLAITVSELPNSGILGAAALCYDKEAYSNSR